MNPGPLTAPLRGHRRPTAAYGSTQFEFAARELYL